MLTCMTMKKLTIIHDPILAHILKGRLQADGVDCHILHEDSNRVYGQILGGVVLMVAEEDEMKARQILAESGVDGEDTAEII